MNQYRVTFEHPMRLFDDSQAVCTGSVLVAAPDLNAARKSFIKLVRHRMRAGIRAVEFCGEIVEHPLEKAATK